LGPRGLLPSARLAQIGVRPHVAPPAVQDHRAPGVVVERLGLSLAHALASPLTLIRGRAQLLARDAKDGDVAGAAQQLLDQVGSIVELLRRVQEFGRLASPAPGLAELGPELLPLQTLTTRAVAAGVELSVAAGLAGPGALPRGLVAQVVSGLLGYLELAGFRGSIELCRSRVEQRQLECVRIALAVQQGGLPSGRRALMDPWLEETAQPVPARLELALALGVAQKADGWFELEPGADGAPTLLVYLPIRP
jgi:two-component system, NtrC family, sensor kinase